MAYETSEQLLAEISDYWYKRPGGNLYKLIDAFNEPLEGIGTNANKVERWRALKDAKGTTLDLFGADIQTYRPSQDDDNYRFIIHIMELLSRAQGTIPSIYKIASSALQTGEGFKVWKTSIRHVGIQVPFDAVKTLRMQKFIIRNFQKMLAMGYWIDEIVFVTTTNLPLYVGMGTQIKHRKIERSPVKWWTGWKARTSDKQYIGVATQIKHRNTLSSNAKWWTGWKAESTRSQFIGVVGQLAKSSVWATVAVWSKPQTAEIHAGLTIGNKKLTTTTQSIATE
ncbi:hypothetical protein AEL96_03380 [Lactobacillus crispatus]|uniref:hypothetical protein n=1 Tax=Lactobacillus crispatus TaxID=47770 RepID=UPI0007619B1F|nr:hypothetical protein [Lactobacillus crispatus]KWU06405.1 hypothetical protein AEL96_03380 [Lactobacillus crispatus]